MKRLPRELVNELARLGRVPESCRAQLELMVRATLEAAIGEHEDFRTNNVAADRRSLRRIERAARELSEALRQRSRGADQYLGAGLRVQRRQDRRPSREDYDDILRIPTLILDSAEQALAHLDTPKPQGNPGGPRPANYSFRLLVLRLWNDFKNAGGRLTFSKHMGGSLVMALNLLRDQLPAGIVPKRLPYSRLDRIWRLRSPR